MPTERRGAGMPLAARRTFRFAFVTAGSLALAYGLGMPFPFFAPMFAALLTTAPAPPMPFKGLVGLVAVVTLTLGMGLVLAPMLVEYPVTAVLLIAAGLYFATFLSVGAGKGLVGLLFTIGLTMIPAAGLVAHSLAAGVIHGLLVGIAIAVVCQWLVYPFFPEDVVGARAPAPRPETARARWIALRATLIVLPAVMVVFTNPTLYMPAIIKSVLLAQQGSVVGVRAAGRELLGSTFLAGIFAILFWLALKLWPSLWMYFLWLLVFGTWIAAKMYGVSASRFPPSYWQNVIVTMLILLGPAVEDSVAGRDPYEASAIRFVLFVGVTIYAWLAIVVLERLYARRRPVHRLDPVLEGG